MSDNKLKQKKCRYCSRPCGQPWCPSNIEPDTPQKETGMLKVECDVCKMHQDEHIANRTYKHLYISLIDRVKGNDIKNKRLECCPDCAQKLYEQFAATMDDPSGIWHEKI